MKNHSYTRSPEFPYNLRGQYSSECLLDHCHHSPPYFGKIDDMSSGGVFVYLFVYSRLYWLLGSTARLCKRRFRPSNVKVPTGLRRRDTIYPSLFLGKVVSLLDWPFAGKHLLLTRWVLTDTELFLFVSNSFELELNSALTSFNVLFRKVSKK